MAHTIKRRAAAQWHGLLRVALHQEAAMDRQEQIGLLKRLLHYVETGTTALADAPWHNDVSVYADPAHLALEERILFRRYPILMGFASEWAAPGAFRADDHVGVPILVVRGSDGRLRAFLNVCRHRGAKIAGGAGTARAFSCPYHAWTYDLAGKLRGMPDERCFPGVRSERSSLTELPLCEKHGLVWVIPTPAADGAAGFDIDPWLGGLGRELAGFGLESWHFHDKRLIPETMNWKLIVDTFHEGYHIGFLHRESLKTILHANVADFAAYGLNHRLTFPRKKLERLNSEPEATWDLMWHTTVIYSLFPNTILMLQGDHIELARVFPVDGRVDRAAMELALYVPSAPTTEEEIVHWRKNMQLVLDVVTGEDFPAGRSIQIGLGSGAQSHTVFGRNEPAMIHYHRSLQAALRGESAGNLRRALA
jgi:phenylpropionate dioxygenase-like ring-hydroxylating dioxygenase large terminal subunit